MGLSFILAPLVGASPLQAFAAGAALCSTSLGTTFTLLATSGLTTTRLGVVLTSAAMMDDVVGLIMVQVISNLGSLPSLDAVTVVRPIFVSLAFAILLPLACRFIVLPSTRSIAAKRQSNPESRINKLFQNELTALTVHTVTLTAVVISATYAGSSGLLGAYIAGAMVSWWDDEAPHPLLKRPQTTSLEDRRTSRNADGSVGTPLEMTSVANASPASGEAKEETSGSTSYPSNSGLKIFEKYYGPALQRVLKPFFFVRYPLSLMEKRALTLYRPRWDSPFP